MLTKGLYVRRRVEAVVDQAAARGIAIDGANTLNDSVCRYWFGSADPLMHFVKALEEAKVGDQIAVVGYGSGADALLFEVTDEIDKIRDTRRGIGKHLANKRELNSYQKMASFRELLPTEKGIRGDSIAFTAFSEMWRSRRQILGLCGSLYKACGVPQYPVQKVCANPLTLRPYDRARNSQCSYPTLFSRAGNRESSIL